MQMRVLPVADESPRAALFFPLLHNEGTVHKTARLTKALSARQRGSQNKEDNCKASSQEMWGNKVSTCHVVKCC